MHLEKDFVMEVYKVFFENKHFYHEFANLEDKKGYKRCNRMVTSNNPINFEMREYYPVASNRQGKYNVYPDNLIVYNNKSIKTAIEHDLGNGQDVILISNEGLTFLRQLYECEITYDPAINDDVLHLFSIYEVFKSIKSCISAYVSPHESYTFYASYLLYIKMGCGTGNSEQCSKCIIELISRLLNTKKHCKCRKCVNSIFDECKNILTICKVKFAFSKNLQTIITKAMNDLVANSPLHFEYSIVKNAMIDLIAKLNYQKHYSEIRDILREFHRNECKTRFFKNFNLYDFLLFYLFYLKEKSNDNIKNLIFTMKAKLNIDLTHEKLSIDPTYVFEWYFKCYCKLFEQTCENNRKMRYMINGKRYLKRKVKPTIRIKIVSQKVQTKGSGQKIYPFSPMVERIKECGNKGHLYAAKKRLYFD